MTCTRTARLLPQSHFPSTPFPFLVSLPPPVGSRTTSPSPPTPPPPRCVRERVGPAKGDRLRLPRFSCYVCLVVLAWVGLRGALLILAHILKIGTKLIELAPSNCNSCFPQVHMKEAGAPWREGAERRECACVVFVLCVCVCVCGSVLCLYGCVHVCVAHGRREAVPLAARCGYELLWARL